MTATDDAVKHYTTTVEAVDALKAAGTDVARAFLAAISERLADALVPPLAPEPLESLYDAPDGFYSDCDGDVWEVVDGRSSFVVRENGSRTSNGRADVSGWRASRDHCRPFTPVQKPEILS